MHDLIQEFSTDVRGPVRLLRLPLDQGASVALFDAAATPRWIAKTGAGAAACQRLRREAQALQRLEPWATDLHVPRVLGWSETGAAECASCCLIQSGLAGEPPRWRARARLGRSAAARIDEVLRWIGRLQQAVPAPRFGDLGAVLQWERDLATADLGRYPRWQAPLRLLLGGLPDFRGGPPLLAVHGDLWHGNLIEDRQRGSTRLGAVDWSGFDSGSALYDPLTFLACLPAPTPACAWQAWLHRLFERGPIRNALRAWARTCGYAAEECHAAFYQFLLRRARWELGMEIQYRHPHEVAAAEQRWLPLSEWLANHGYPDPFQADTAALAFTA